MFHHKLSDFVDIDQLFFIAPSVSHFMITASLDRHACKLQPQRFVQTQGGNSSPRWVKERVDWVTTNMSSYAFAILAKNTNDKEGSYSSRT